MNNIILGNGEVASVLKKWLKGTVKTYDKGDWEGLDNPDCDYLHVAIPYTDKFVSIVQTAERVFSPDITCIHSTVKPGTSKQLNALYSPVLGRHSDDFAKNVKMYRKFVAGPEKEAYEISIQIGLSCEFWGDNTSELEYAKIMSTTRMYWDLVFQKMIQSDCKVNDYNIHQVYTRWTDNYNAGIRQNHPKWERPIYSVMETEFPGGHCLRPNIHLVDNEITSFLKAYEKGVLYYVTEGK